VGESFFLNLKSVVLDTAGAEIVDLPLASSIAEYFTGRPR